MKLNQKHIGVAITGSFCTFQSCFREIEHLLEEGAKVTTIFSKHAATIVSRFGSGPDFIDYARELTGNEPILSIEAAEAIGPKKLFDIITILPCTGNTMAKLANGITDTPVLMAAKAHLRNQRPLVLSLASNDALAMNLKNIGLLLNVKNIYFVPFGQDQPEGKPYSLIAHTNCLLPSLEAALDGKQIQPILNSPFQREVNH